MLDAVIALVGMLFLASFVLSMVAFLDSDDTPAPELSPERIVKEDNVSVHASALASILMSAEIGRQARDLLDLVNDGHIAIGTVSLDGRVESLQGGLLRLLGTRSEDWIGHHVSERHEEDALARARSGKSTAWRQLDAIAEKHELSVHYLPRRGIDGNVDGAIVVLLAIEKGDRSVG